MVRGGAYKRGQLAILCNYSTTLQPDVKLPNKLPAMFVS